MRLVRVAARAGVFAQFGLEERVDRSGVDEVDQAVGEVAFLGAGGQPDGQPPGSDVVDDGAAAVGFGDAVGDEPLIQREVWQRAVLGAAGSRVLPEALRRYRSRTSVTPCFFGEVGKPPVVMRRAVLVAMPCVAVQSAASRSGCRLACSCWRLRSPGGWDALAMASGAVRPSSAAQPGMWGQSRWSS